MTIQTPNWVKHAVFYQIFPDRFARSERATPPAGTKFKEWGTPPKEQGYQGGDLLGIVDKLDYLNDLGINALYLNPIFASAANHRYHTFDYFQVDPLLGGNEALRELLDQAHARKMKVVLDGVFNHASRGFWAFHHILENGPNSPYLDWFIIKDWPLRPYTSTKKNLPNYMCWWDLPALPKFNTDNPGVRAYIMDVARYWIDFGIDGWRLDVPAEIDDDNFWRDFRKVVKKANPEAYICGEIWEPAQRWLQGDQFDAVMNYVFQRAVLGFFGGKNLNTKEKPGGFKLKKITAPKFAQTIDEMHDLYDWEINHVQLNLLDSHDTARLRWLLGNDEEAVRMSVLFQMTMPGAPCVYYGDEIGMNSGSDPDCRAAFPWHQPDSWDNESLTFYKKAIALRQKYTVLRSGGFYPLYSKKGVYGFARQLDEQQAIVIFNSNPTPVTITLPPAPLTLDGQVFQAVWGEGLYQVKRSKLKGVTIPERDALILMLS